MANISELLSDAGLSDKEIPVFLSLFKNGPTTVSEIARETTITRTHIYDIIRGLVKKGLVIENSRIGAKQYESINHDGLVAMVSKKQKSFAELKQAMVEAASDFNDLRGDAKQSTTVRFFNGPKGVRALYEEMRYDLNRKRGKDNEVMTIFSPRQIDEALPGWFDVAKNINVPMYMHKRAIIFGEEKFDTYVNRVEKEESTYEYKFWDKPEQKLITDTVSWHQKIAYIHSAIGEYDQQRDESRNNNGYQQFGYASTRPPNHISVSLAKGCNGVYFVCP